MIGGYQSLVLMEHAAIRSVSRADILNKNTLVQCLSNNVARRLNNISDTLCQEKRVAVLHDHAPWWHEL